MESLHFFMILLLAHIYLVIGYNLEAEKSTIQDRVLYTDKIHQDQKSSNNFDPEIIQLKVNGDYESKNEFGQQNGIASNTLIKFFQFSIDSHDQAGSDDLNIHVKHSCQDLRVYYSQQHKFPSKYDDLDFKCQFLSKSLCIINHKLLEKSKPVQLGVYYPRGCAFWVRVTQQSDIPQIKIGDQFVFESKQGSLNIDLPMPRDKIFGQLIVRYENIESDEQPLFNQIQITPSDELHDKMDFQQVGNELFLHFYNNHNLTELKLQARSSQPFKIMIDTQPIYENQILLFLETQRGFVFKDQEISFKVVLSHQQEQQIHKTSFYIEILTIQGQLDLYIPANSNPDLLSKYQNHHTIIQTRQLIKVNQQLFNDHDQKFINVIIKSLAPLSIFQISTKFDVEKIQTFDLKLNKPFIGYVDLNQNHHFNLIFDSTEEQIYDIIGDIPQGKAILSLKMCVQDPPQETEESSEQMQSVDDSFYDCLSQNEYMMKSKQPLSTFESQYRMEDEDKLIATVDSGSVISFKYIKEICFGKINSKIKSLCQFVLTIQNMQSTRASYQLLFKVQDSPYRIIPFLPLMFCSEGDPINLIINKQPDAKNVSLILTKLFGGVINKIENKYPNYENSMEELKFQLIPKQRTCFNFLVIFDQLNKFPNYIQLKEGHPLQFQVSDRKILYFLFQAKNVNDEILTIRLNSNIGGVQGYVLINTHNVKQVPNFDNKDYYITNSEPLQIKSDNSSQDKIYTIAVEPKFNQSVSYTIVYEVNQTINQVLFQQLVKGKIDQDKQQKQYEILFDPDGEDFEVIIKEGKNILMLFSFMNMHPTYTTAQFVLDSQSSTKIKIDQKLIQNYGGKSGTLFITVGSLQKAESFQFIAKKVYMPQQLDQVGELNDYYFAHQQHKAYYYQFDSSERIIFRVISKYQNLKIYAKFANQEEFLGQLYEGNLDQKSIEDIYANQNQHEVEWQQFSDYGQSLIIIETEQLKQQQCFLSTYGCVLLLNITQQQNCKLRRTTILQEEERYFSIYTSRDIERILMEKPLHYKLINQSYAYFQFEILDDIKQTTISVIPTDDSDPDLYVHWQSQTNQYPDKEFSHFSSNNFKSDILIIRSDDTLFQQSGGMLGLFTIAVYSDSTSSFRLEVTSGESQFHSLDANLQISQAYALGFQDSNSRFVYFKFEYVYADRFWIHINKQTSYGSLRVKVYNYVPKKWRNYKNSDLVQNLIDEIEVQHGMFDGILTFNRQIVSGENQYSNFYVFEIESLEGEQIQFDILAITNSRPFILQDHQIIFDISGQNTKIFHNTNFRRCYLVNAFDGGLKVLKGFKADHLSEIEIESRTKFEFCINNQIYFSFQSINDEPVHFSIQVNSDNNFHHLTFNKLFSGEVKQNKQSVGFIFAQPDTRRVTIQVCVADGIVPNITFQYIQNKLKMVRQTLKNMLSMSQTQCTQQEYLMGHIDGHYEIILEALSSAPYQLVLSSNDFITLLPNRRLYQEAIQEDASRLYSVMVPNGYELLINYHDCIGASQLYYEKSKTLFQNFKIIVETGPVKFGKIKGVFMVIPYVIEAYDLYQPEVIINAKLKRFTDSLALQITGIDCIQHGCPFMNLYPLQYVIYHFTVSNRKFYQNMGACDFTVDALKHLDYLNKKSPRIIHEEVLQNHSSIDKETFVDLRVESDNIPKNKTIWAKIMVELYYETIPEPFIYVTQVLKGEIRNLEVHKEIVPLSLYKAYQITRKFFLKNIWVILIFSLMILTGLYILCRKKSVAIKIQQQDTGFQQIDGCDSDEVLQESIIQDKLKREKLDLEPNEIHI